MDAIAKARATTQAVGVSHDNGFGLLRLFFAALVIVAHTPEMHDGSRDREILWRLTGSMSFGEMAVDGFFVISGYLITASFLGSRSFGDYLTKRVARIYPAFLVAYAVCVLVVAPLADVVWASGPQEIASIVARAFLLLSPDPGHVFPGMQGPTLNGSTWTIIYEFQCYIIVGMLGSLGLLRRRWAVLGLTALLALYVIATHRGYHHVEADPSTFVYGFHDVFTRNGLYMTAHAILIPNWRLLAVFLIGSCFFLFGDRLRFTRIGALLCLPAMLACLFMPPLADLGFALFGGYIVFFLAQAASGTVFARINNRDDVSYGLYLYAWPVEKLIFWYFPATPLVVAGAATIVLAYALGWLSWLVVEKPAMARLRSAMKRRPVTLTPTGPT